MSETKPKILIAEDEFLPATHLRTMLGRAGHEIVGPVSTARECVEEARLAKPDLILLDIRLAGETDGIDAAREIRSFDKDVDIIFMSGYQESALRERAMAQGPLAFLVKPVLLKDIQSIMDRPRKPAELPPRDITAS